MPEKPPDRAVALRYSGEGAPSVTAAGRGHVAEKILAIAEEAGVPVRRDPALVRALETLEIGREIPEELFSAVAEVLAWAYALDGEASRERPGRSY
ncbi:MAG: EscU/YscU/HrcU family type III secretion system export apparatus switch protein [Actinomycetota bacterium]|nr:EscU/YscU/HrcU family type III secretion system export apparatus switch protein [Actinomycetota bacterium]